MKHSRLFYLLFLYLIFSTWLIQPVFPQQQNPESITITTYYPAPFGVYQSLQLYPTNPAPDTCATATDLGKIYYNNSSYQLMLCQQDTLGNINWQNIGAGYWTLNGNNLYPNNNNWNVGIGTTMPDDALVISRNSDFSIKLQRTGVVPREWHLSNVTQDPSGAPVRFRIWDHTASRERFTITSDGNVGIGVITPFAPYGRGSNLDVNGAVSQRLYNTGNRLTFSGWYNSGAPGQPYLEFNIDNVALFGISVWLSSRKQKTDITDIEVDTSQIYKLRPVSFY